MSFSFGGGGGYTSVRQFLGWQNYQDATTSVTPIALTTPGTWYDLTNDGAGPLTTSAYKVTGHGDIFNTSTNTFDFSSLSIGDQVEFRFEVEVETTSPNTAVACRLAFGPSYAFNLLFNVRNFKNATSGEQGRILRDFSFAMFNTDTLNNPAKFQASADAAGASVKVLGWKIDTERMSL